MHRSWPPSPIVEDEIASLAKEFGSDSTESDSSHGVPPADSRGIVDQYPLIIDVDDKPETTATKIKDVFSKPTRLPTPPHDPPSRRRDEERSKPPPGETRFIHIPAVSDTEREIPPAPRRPRSKSTIGLAAEEASRGRPHVHRINTDVGPGLHGMATGQRRAPSPYAYRASTSNLSSSALDAALDDKTKVSLLSPDSAVLPRPTDAGRRARSQRPNRSARAPEGSDEDRRESYRRHRSKSRVDRGSFSKYPASSGDERLDTSKSDRPRRSERSPPRDRRPIVTHRSAHGDITPPQTPGHPKESPYTSAAEESDRRRHHERPRMERRFSKESPYTSSTENRSSRRESDDKARARSRRRSVHRPGKLQLDAVDQQASERSEQKTQQAARTPKTPKTPIDDFERAFQENQNKTPRSRLVDEIGPSPLSTPPTSPPRERKGGDYFGLSASAPAPAQPRSRPPSLSENPLKPVTTLLGAATYGAATLAAKAAPSLSRSSTASADTFPSLGSQGSVASGQRSRKPSPVYEDPRPISRAGSTASRDEIVTSRSNTYPPSDRPVSRAGSTTSQDVLPNRATMATTFERPVSRNGFATSATPHPPLTPRAASYSSIPEQAHMRPSARRTYSTTSGATVNVASSGPQGRHISSNLAQSSYTPASYASTPTTEKPPAASSPTEVKKPISFPMCPRPFATSGLQGWYTLSGFQNFDICPSCTRVLGESPLRDHLVPIRYKPASDEITCALSRPWVRIVVARCLKDGSSNSGVLQSLTTPPPDIHPCPGRRVEIRKWYHLIDPATKAPIQGFTVCTSCVRAVDIVFPELYKEKIFERPQAILAQERSCNLFAGSKHFYSIVNELDLLARYSKKNDLRAKDVVVFGEFVRQKVKTRECARDAMLATPLWHFLASLPEFTICEECFEEVVWPLRDKAIARDVGKTLQKVPVQRPANYVAGISCQLYSERMRRIFKDAVSRNDFEALRHAALTRYNIEHRLQENQRRFEQDQRNGHDRRADIQRNLEYWKQYE